MARIKFPNTFAGVAKLFTLFKTKFDAEAGASVTQPFLDEQGIDPDADAVTVTAAVAANTAFAQAEKDAEEQSEKRDDVFEPVFKDHTGSVQFLKKLFRNNVTKLGEWGVTVDARGRVVYPPDFTGRTVVVLALITKHNSFAAGTSPLQPFLDENEIDLADNQTDVATAIAAHDEFNTQDGLKEEKREERDALIAPVEQHLRGIGQFLVGLFHNAPHKAGQWGFEVDSSPQADRTRDVVVTQQSSKVLYQLAVGKIVENIGPIEAKIFKGKTATGEPIVLAPGQKLTIQRGYGTITVVNESASSKVTIEATFNR